MALNISNFGADPVSTMKTATIQTSSTGRNYGWISALGEGIGNVIKGIAQPTLDQPVTIEEKAEFPWLPVIVIGGVVLLGGTALFMANKRGGRKRR